VGRILLEKLIVMLPPSLGGSDRLLKRWYRTTTLQVVTSQRMSTRNKHRTVLLNLKFKRQCKVKKKKHYGG